MSQGIERPADSQPSAASQSDRTRPLRHRGKGSASDRLEGTGGRWQLPAVGDRLFGFRLRAELGRGAFARVFLAEQADLAGRPVVLKVSAIDGDEPQTLAQLQHTHIVPIYSVHEDAAAGLRAVCMPYLGGASLSQILQTLWKTTDRPVRGEQLLGALAAACGTSSSPRGPQPQATQDAAGPASGPRHSVLGLPPPWRDLSYARAAAWIVAQLADGLQHAHQRGVLHRDIKPSNILLGADGQPLLLDFNVAQSLHPGAAEAEARLGGTVAYMAPEHLSALAAHDPVLAQEVGPRADIYSLGMVLYEILAGRRPFTHDASYSPVMPVVVAMALERSRAVPSLRALRPDVPWSLESILRKCLAPNASRRYQQAEDLADDLRRFLEDRPLKHAPELSQVERLYKWVRRHPRLASSGSVAAAALLLLAAAGATLAGVRQHLASTQAQLAAAQAQDRKRAYEAGTVRALCLVNTTTDLQDQLGQGQTVCEETLDLYGVLDQDEWQRGPDWQRLEPAERQVLAEDARELLALLAWARVRRSPGNQAVLREALALLDRTEAIEGLAPSRALWEDRSVYLDRLGEAAAAKAARDRAGQMQPTGARDHYLLATAYSRGGRYAAAAAELDQALSLNPRHYWSLVQRGICYEELGKHTLAVGDFSTCIGLWPEFSWGYFNRGSALERSGNRPEALRDYTAALQRDPDLLPARVNRGLARLELTQYGPALEDFDRAAELGRDDAFLHAGRGAALEGLGRFQEADSAFQAAFARVEAAGDEARIRLCWTYGFAVAARLPEKARQAFEEVLRSDPEHPQALYGCAMLLAGEGREGEAVRYFDRAIAGLPAFAEARRFRAVVLARCGDFDGASRDINWCLEKEPEDGATFYAAACVAAHAAERWPEAPGQKAAEQALTFLQKALARGYGRGRAANDPDLRGIQQRREFRRLISAENEPRDDTRGD